MTKKRRRPIHLHVMVSEEEQALHPSVERPQLFAGDPGPQD